MIKGKWLVFFFVLLVGLKGSIACAFGDVASHPRSTKSIEVLGDVNGDGKIDLAEVIYALQIITGNTPSCDNNHLNLCTTYSTCVNAGGHWWSNNTCNSSLAPPSYAPAESPQKVAYFRYAIPPLGFTAVVGWMQAIDIHGKGSTCKVEVDWMRLHALVDGIDTILYEDNFKSYVPAMNYYRLYDRKPWFKDNENTIMPFTIENSSLVMEPSLYPQRIFHWWNTSRSMVKKNTSRIWFEARVRITGDAGVQAGIDYWKDLNADWAGYDVNNTEAGASNWFGNSTDDWQIISVGQPLMCHGSSE